MGWRVAASLGSQVPQIPALNSTFEPFLLLESNRCTEKKKSPQCWHAAHAVPPQVLRLISIYRLIFTYPRRVFHYLQIICTTGPFTARVYSHARTCKRLSDLSVI